MSGSSDLMKKSTQLELKVSEDSVLEQSSIISAEDGSSLRKAFRPTLSRTMAASDLNLIKLHANESSQTLIGEQQRQDSSMSALAGDHTAIEDAVNRRLVIMTKMTELNGGVVPTLKTVTLMQKTMAKLAKRNEGKIARGGKEGNAVEFMGLVQALLDKKDRGEIEADEGFKLLANEQSRSSSLAQLTAPQRPIRPSISRANATLKKNLIILTDDNKEDEFTANSKDKAGNEILGGDDSSIDESVPNSLNSTTLENFKPFARGSISKPSKPIHAQVDSLPTKRLTIGCPDTFAVSDAAVDPKNATILPKRNGGGDEEPKEEPTVDHKKAMMAMLAKRNGGGDDEPKEEPAVDPKKAMMAMLAKRNGGGDDEPKEEPAVDPKKAMMAMLAKRIGVGDDEPKEEPAVDPKKAMMAMLAKRNGGGDDEPKEQPKSAPAADVVLLKDDPRYGKYMKMLKVGLVPDSVAHKMISDGIVSSHTEAMVILSMDPNGPAPALSSSKPAASSRPAILLKDDPKYLKYLKMVKLGLPKEAAAQKMWSEGAAPTMEDALSVMDMDPDGPSPNFSKESAPISCDTKISQKVPVKDHPTYGKYFKMVKSGVPIEAIRLKMHTEGVDVTFIDKDPEELVALETEMEELVPLMDHPVYAKFFLMLKVGTPIDVVRMKMKQEGANVSYIDKEPSELVPLNVKIKAAAVTKIVVPYVRKKKLFLGYFGPGKVSSNSVWARGSIKGLQFDESEFESLFIETADSSNKEEKVSEEPKKKQKLALIDAKRSQNAGIALARIKKTFEEVRTSISIMDSGDFSTEQLLSLGEYLPTDEEMRTLKPHVNGDMSVLGPAERYMITMMGLPCAKKRIDVMVFKNQFAEKLLEIQCTIDVIEKSCNSVRNSERLQMVLKCILKIGNRMNEGESYIGFTLESLLKLQEAKAFDKKTSVLQYVIMLIKRTNEDWLLLPTDLEGIGEAARISMDQLDADRLTLIKGLHENYEFYSRNQISSQQRETSSEKQNDRASSSISRFFTEALQLCKTLDESFEKTKSLYLNLLLYMGENVALPSNDFFSTLYRFSQGFANTRDEFERVRIAEERKKKRELDSKLRR